ncbi:MAG: 3'(2'),5'-bisphosphate nucleotidase CysQ [Planctomycetes bacterium]|nr:3'(2'),5'-bisphosphate nucleotidase CysQ [Planctomycetota bacterium]
MTTRSADLAHAVLALRDAMDILRRRAAEAVSYSVKDGGGLVTEADHEVDAMLRAYLPQADDGWLSEESEDDRTRLACRRVWVVDPIDGTRAFIARRPEYSTSIALLEDGEPVLGAIGNPATGVLVYGGPGLGVAVEGSPDLDWSGEPGDLRVLASRSELKRGEWRPFERPGTTAIAMGSVAYSLALVAAGAAEATWTMYPKHEWDVAAGVALVRGAGGSVWLPRGGHLLWNRRSPRFLSFAASAPGLQERAQAAMQVRS